jgi:hypothetical protein
MSDACKFPYPGAIDADGHILEPPDLWERYIDPQFRDRAIRLYLPSRLCHSQKKRAAKCWETM